MAYGLPSRGQSDWDDELNNSVEALRSETQTATSVSEQARSNATQAIALAQDAAARVETISGLTGEDGAVAVLVNTPASETAVALSATYVPDAVTSFGATPLTDVTITAIGGAGPVPIGVLADGVLYGATSTHLHASTNSGTTWTQLSAVNTVGGGLPRRVFDLPSGEVLVVRQNTIIRSTGWATNRATATWAVVFDLAPATTHFDAWSVDCKGSKIIATEYGGYAAEPWRVWISLDGGTTFDLSHDLGAVYTAGQLDGTHMHGVAYDEHRDVFWFANGDEAGAAQVWWSDDDGTTWNPIANLIGKERHTALMPMPEGVLLGTDAGSNVALNGVYRISPDNPEDITLAYEANVGIGGLTHVACSSQVGSDGIGYMSFAPWQTSGIPSVMVASVDGRSVQEIWRDPSPVTGSVTERQLVLAVGPDLNGNIIGHLSSDTTTNGWLVVGKAPRRGGRVVERVDTGRATGGVSVNQTALAVAASAQATSDNSVAVGPSAKAGTGSTTSTKNTAVGQGARAGAETGVFQSGTAVGYLANAKGFGSTVIGADAVAEASAVAVGRAATSAGTGVVIGDGASQSAIQSVAIGQAATANFTRAVAVGHSADVSSVDSVAIGADAQGGWKGTALGGSASAAFEGSVALGQATATTAVFQVAIGARGVMALNIAATPATPTGGGVLYVEAGALKYKGSSGTVTVIAPA